MSTLPHLGEAFSPDCESLWVADEIATIQWLRISVVKLTYLALRLVWYCQSIYMHKLLWVIFDDMYSAWWSEEEIYTIELTVVVDTIP